MLCEGSQPARVSLGRGWNQLPHSRAPARDGIRCKLRVRQFRILGRGFSDTRFAFCEIGNASLCQSTTFYRLLNKAVYVSLLPDCWCYFSQATHWGSGWNQGTCVFGLHAGLFHIPSIISPKKKWRLRINNLPKVIPVSPSRSALQAHLTHCYSPQTKNHQKPDCVVYNEGGNAKVLERRFTFQLCHLWGLLSPTLI